MKTFRSHLQCHKEQRVIVDSVTTKDLGDIMLIITSEGFSATHFMTRESARELAENILALANGDEKA